LRFALRFDFLIHVDFVTWLSIYFAVMVPALLLTFAALLYRLLFILAGAPVDWANFSPLASIFPSSGLFLSKKRVAIWPLSLPLYPKTFEGWLQALTVGHPGLPPTYLFLRTLVSDLLFTSLFLLTQALLRPQRASSDLPGTLTHPTV
jgi:hypothetical protein